MSKTYDIFINHSWMYGDSYKRLIEFLNENLYFYLYDY